MARKILPKQIFNRELLIKKLKENKMKKKVFYSTLGISESAGKEKFLYKRCSISQQERLKIKELFNLSVEEFYEMFYTDN